MLVVIYTHRVAVYAPLLGGVFRLVSLCAPPAHGALLLVFGVPLGGTLRLVLLFAPPVHDEFPV